MRVAGHLSNKKVTFSGSLTALPHAFYVVRKNIFTCCGILRFIRNVKGILALLGCYGVHTRD